ncbi:hypothetical protein N8T08_001813 [Aspergillus melleus]|uniref:Uncharacterized protein n=1 Tax=Aspergillus melleus TaxID=138277 RepID=A0ACC3B8X0_9EURO|nr:hypothetical protein N8T08_001813 [Aspergillus melleus]
MAPFPRPHPDTRVRKKKVKDPDTYKIRPRAYVLVLVIIYAGFSLTAWVILCVLNQRPIGKPSYDITVVEDDDFEKLERQVEKWYQAARFISGVVGALTVPLTSSVCASAAVNYTQTRSARSLGSNFLYFAIALHIFGGLINPLQQVLLSQGEALVHRGLASFSGYNEIFKLATPEKLERADDGSTIAVLRALLSATQRNDSSQYLWTGQKNNCTKEYESSEHSILTRSIFDCIPSPNDDQFEKDYMKNPPPDLFVAHLSPRFSSGAIRQYAPRINSSIKRENLRQDEFPHDCPGNSFYRNYKASPGDFNERLSVCMPSNLSASPFRHTQDRYDFEEVLYVMMLSSRLTDMITFKLTLSTTVGYFELPNSKNGNKPGPVLLKDPDMICAWPHCAPQFGGPSTPLLDNGRPYYTAISSPDLNAGPPNLGYDDNGKFYLELVPAKGPLALLTIAMFGNNSFIETQFRPENWNSTDIEPGPWLCAGYGPLSLLSSYPDCDYTNHGPGGVSTIGNWLTVLVDSNIYSLFNQAAFLANQVILTQDDPYRDLQALPIYYQGMQPIKKPTMSKATMVVISILLAVYLLCLLAVSAWASIRIGWTVSLDAYAMLKIGAALGTDSLHSNAIREGKENVLDKLPGWVGEEDSTAYTGSLVVGGKASLKWKRRYWKGNDVAL